MNEFKFSNLELVNAIWNKKWHLIILGIAGMLLGVIISSPFIIKPEYQSKAVVFPTNLAPYSEESFTEQMLQWLHSDIIKTNVINNLDLIEHYSIDTNEKYYISTVNFLFTKNVSMSRTEYESVEIIASDKNPEMAYNLVINVLDEYNKLIKDAHIEKSQEIITLRKSMLDRQVKIVDSISSQLKEYFNKGLYNLDAQSKEVTRGYLRTIEGATKGNLNFEEIENVRKAIKKDGVAFINVNTSLYDALSYLRVKKMEYDDALSAYLRDKNFTYYTYVSKPVVPDKKSKPIRWLIVFISGFSLFGFGLVYFLISNSADQFNRKK
jgi:LPS O-antigen subunit length determinant protein (WzzB/FepE family)